MATKKTEEKVEVTETSSAPEVAEVISAPVADDVSNGGKKEDLEKVDANAVANESSEPVAPKVVSYSNGTQSFEDSSIQKVTHPEIVQGVYQFDNLAPQVQYVDNIETPLVMREKRVIRESLSKAQIQAVMDDMEKNRPAVFADRKADLERQRDAALD